MINNIIKQNGSQLGYPHYIFISLPNNLIRTNKTSRNHFILQKEEVYIARKWEEDEIRLVTWNLKAKELMGQHRKAEEEATFIRTSYFYIYIYIQRVCAMCVLVCIHIYKLQVLILLKYVSIWVSLVGGSFGTSGTRFYKPRPENASIKHKPYYLSHWINKNNLALSVLYF